MDTEITTRYFIVSCLAALLGLFVLLYLTDSCKSTCFDEYIPLENAKENNIYKCSENATAELVISPKYAIICRCKKDLYLSDGGTSLDSEAK